MKKFTFLTLILAVVLTGCSKFDSVDPNETTTNNPIVNTTDQGSESLSMNDLNISNSFDWSMVKTLDVEISLPEDDDSRLLKIYSQDGKQLYFRGHPEDNSNVIKTKITVPTHESVLMIKYGEGDTYPFIGSDLEGLNLNLKMSSSLKSSLKTEDCDSNEDPDITSLGGFQFEFDGMVENINGTSTWTYTVTGMAPSGSGNEFHDLSHWVLALCDDHGVNSGTPTGWELNTDPTLGVYGIKWDKEINKFGGTATFSFTLDGLYDVIPINVVAFKASGDLFYCTIPGPSCEGTTPDPDPEPELDGTFAVEDLWPGQGDYDINDLVVEYDFDITKDNEEKIEHITATFTIRAFGATLHNGFGFEFPGVAPEDIVSVTGYDIYNTSTYSLSSNGTENGQENATFIVYDDAYRMMDHPGSGIGVNTDKPAPYVDPVTITLEIEFVEDAVTYSQLNIGEFNPFIVVDQNRDMEVHLPNFAPTTLASDSYFGTYDDNTSPADERYYKTHNNLFWAINIPARFDYPVEKQVILGAYAHFAEWAQSDGVDYPDWYEDNAGYRNASVIY